MKGIITLENANSHLAQDGICIVPNVLSLDDVSKLSEILDKVALDERTSGAAWFSHGNQRIFMLLNKSEEFLRLVTHPIALGMIQQILGEHFLLSSLTANIASPGNNAQALHADQGYIPDPWNRAEVVNMIWIIDEFRDQNGATRFVRGSHLKGVNPDVTGTTTESLSAAPGSLVCMDGRLWHGTGVNAENTGCRRAIFAYYCRPYIRQQENITRSLLPRIRSRLTYEEREILGFHIWNGLGAINGLPTEWMDGRVRIGPNAFEPE